MEEIVRHMTSLLAVVAPILTGLFILWKKISKDNLKVLQKINKIDKHKISYKVCDQRRAECPCKNNLKGK